MGNLLEFTLIALGNCSGHFICISLCRPHNRAAEQRLRVSPTVTLLVSGVARSQTGWYDSESLLYPAALTLPGTVSRAEHELGKY